MNEDELEQARRAHAEHDWPAAAARFAAVRAESMSADDLAAYSDAAWWLGDTDEALRLSAAAYDAFLADSRAPEAAKAAMDLAVTHLLRGDDPQGIGWLGRARHLAEQLPESPLHGYLLYVTEVEANFAEADPAAALDAARRVQTFGRRFDHPELVAAGLNGEGRALLKAGQVTEGLARLDEAMVIVLDGRLAPELAGNLYCNTIAACHEVADMRRMTHWTELAERWVAALPAAVLFGGICRVHRAQLQLLHGEWKEAERNALLMADELDGISVANAAEAWYVVGEVRRLRGDLTAADAYDEAHARGRDPQPGRALLLLSSGDAAAAATSVRSALAAAGSDPLRRAPLCAAAVEISLAAGRLDEAHSAEAELAATAARYKTSGLAAMAATAHGSVLLADGRPDEALAVLRDACSRWHALGADYDVAGTCRRLADAYRALGDEASADAEIAQMEAARARLGVQQVEPDASYGLTGREREVLALVADGYSNREIADELYISDRTVARHLTNIFHKLGVRSRTQAARFALDHGLRGTA